jgi:tyrosyl-tRNA synthetase
MPTSLATLLDQLAWRGLIHHQTPGLADRLRRGSITGYIGFDPTAPSLQVGNLVPVMLLAHLQRVGGKPIVLLGGGTGLIGDPSGKSAERPLLETAQVEANVARQREQFGRFLEFGRGATDALMADNAAWLTKLDLVGFLRDTGKHFTVGYMLQKESVKSRVESGISYTEFSYMLLQAYDFLELFRRHRCELQMGASDQWGNITAGIELIRRAEGAEAHGLVAPLLTAASGAKFGKSEGNAIWLDPALTSPYQFHQYWINVDDRDVERLLAMLTFLERPAVADLMARHRADPGGRVPHRALARDLTTRVHGEAAADGAEQAGRVLFGELEPRRAGAATWAMLARELPHAPLPATVREDTPVLDLVAATDLVKSRGDARRQLAQGGITVNGARATEDGSTGPALDGGYYWVQRGRKTSFIFTPSNGS